jgi:predicted dehydrogenase
MADFPSRRNFLTHSLQAATTASAATLLAQGRSIGAARSIGTTSANKIKIGQMGVGHAHAKGKLEAFRQSAEYEVVGVVEPNEELRQDALKSDIYQDIRWMTQEEMLNAPGLQVAAIETSVPDLLDTAQICVDAGLHIHLDKPAGRSLSQFKKVLEMADRQSRTVQMGYMYRYNPGVRLLKKLLAKGWLGDPFEIEAVMSKVLSRYKRRLWSEHPGGTMFELGCHLIDLAVGLLGPPQQVTPINQHAAKMDDPLLDNMLTVCTWPRAIGTLKSSGLEVEGFARRHFTLCGTEGTVQIQPMDNPSVRLALSKPRGHYQTEYQRIDFEPYQRYVDDLADLAQIVRGEKESDYNSAHDLAVQKVILQACGLPF